MKMLIVEVYKKPYVKKVLQCIHVSCLFIDSTHTHTLTWRYHTHTHTNMTVPHTHTQIHTHAPTFETSCTTIWSTSLFSFFFFGYWPVDVLSVASGHSRRRGADLQNSRIGRAGLAGCAETRVSTGWLRLTSCKAGWLSLTLPCLLPLAE